MYLKK